ncbi:S66 peptidase family protein [Occallatibacter riparius]|uniref:LD-carboxypeptidase n=1 Tax=Occallatibacter riparius TaxID=1002689 RepID=A0A9J7BTK2_9BACT|nr:LD-carboxypeptidase [Occallatibacter riparius]UWZ84238.1 LD-carboxypeptidase [Occallatibacter riparius]
MESAPLVRLAPVEEGAGVSIVAPASFARQDRIDDGVKGLQAAGFVPRFAENALARGPLFFAGTPEQRISDLHSAFADTEAHMIMALRGGYGSNYLLDRLDLELIRSHPKPFFAYSDLTGIQLHLLDKLGLPVFHGPMLAADFYLEDGVHLASFNAALAGEPYTVGAAEGLRSLRKGSASGTLYGGCLSIIVSLLGTAYEPQTEGKLLFLEDVGAKPYQIDRMLWQLRHAGKLDGVRGIVFGEMLDCASPGVGPELLEQAILSALEGIDVPVAFGLRSGHVSRQNVTLTFGVQAELEMGEETELRIFEPAVKKSENR